MNDFLNIAYEKAENGDISILMISRKTKDSGVEIVKVFTDNEAEKLYSVLTT
jgi:hypothetical protein